jgi:hypothetical protein
LGAQAVGLLQELGYTDVRHYPGGLAEWLDAKASTPPARPETVPAARGHAGRGARQAVPTRRVGTLPRVGLPGRVSRFVYALADQSVSRLFRLWLEVVVACGVVYWLLGALSFGALRSAEGPIAGGVSSGFSGLLSAIYFSAVTATSVGYGDIVPVGLARVVAIAEGSAGLILFGCVVSKFVSRRQEQLLAETHRIAFEDRLGRVRTNLHLVRTELLETARLCEGRAEPPPQALARVESASMIFVGELHAVHDLLYRPERAPGETELEALLAGVVSVFREFIELMACAQLKPGDRTPAFAASLRTMTRLAREICGDCVPREFAPALKTWMDQIQRLAGDVEQI